MLAACIEGNKNYIINHIEGIHDNYIEIIVENGHFELIKLLHERGYNMENALRAACRNSKHQIIEYLLKVNIPIDDDIIYDICSSNNLNILNMIEKVGLKLHNSSFLIAVINDSLCLAKEFYKRGYDINYRDNLNYSFTALHYACLQENKDMVNFLLKIGVDIGKDSEGKMPYEHTNNPNIRNLFL